MLTERTWLVRKHDDQEWRFAYATNQTDALHSCFPDYKWDFCILREHDDVWTYSGNQGWAEVKVVKE